MDLRDQLKRIRRYIRDPDGNLWSRAMLVNLYNDVQRDLQSKTNYLVDVSALRVPPAYHFSYLFDWEWRHLPSTESQFYQALRYQHQGDFVICHRWESQLDSSGDASDEGSHFTHPWEAFMTTSGEIVKIHFPSNFHEERLLAYDWKPLEYVTKKSLQKTDSGYITRTGETFWYYREDNLDNSFVPYPLPSTVSWQDIVVSPNPDYLYTQSWETTYMDGTGGQFGKVDSDETRTYIFVFETLNSTAEDPAIYGMWIFEADYSTEGMVVHVSSDTTDGSLGTISTRSGSLFSSDEGIVVDVIDGDDSFICIYDVMPTDLSADDDESDFPEFLRKYIEYGVIGRAYRANTDGNIKSLADYWDARYEAGISVIKKHMSKRMQDRDYRLVTQSVPGVRRRGHARLPSTYPSI